MLSMNYAYDAKESTDQDQKPLLMGLDFLASSDLLDFIHFSNNNNNIKVQSMKVFTTMPAIAAVSTLTSCALGDCGSALDNPKRIGALIG
jgi:hypothetical protein